MKESEATRQVDRYRLQGLLATGGMGAVYRAFDTRLHRSVALKQILPARAADARARERFRNEARACAALSHPSIVQVFDVVDGDQSDWIVMELVEGESLAQRLRRGPLNPAEALEVARDVAAGLAAAHGKGIVHRDLKAENVLVTGAGRAKILDFGLAKLLDPEESSLTESGALLGTRRAMSPEQVRGQAVDHRSDLFSFGTLCYEMLVGSSPFAGRTPFETLSRITAHHPPPPGEVDPRLPEELSRLVDRLLEKDPNRRPQSAEEVLRELDRASLRRLPAGGEPRAPWEAAPGLHLEPTVSSTGKPGAARGGAWRRTVAVAVAAALALVAVAAVLTAWRSLRPRRPSPPEALHVAVLSTRLEPPDSAPEESPLVAGGVRSEDAEAERMALGLRTTLLRELGALEGITVVAPEHVDAPAGGPREVARALAAEEVVVSGLRCRRQDCRLSVDRLRGEDGSVLWPATLEIPRGDLSLLRTAAEAWVRRAYGDRRRRQQLTGSTTEVPVEAFERYLDLRQRYLAASGETRYGELLAELRALRASTPGFVDAALLEGQVGRLSFARSRREEDLVAAFEALEEARRWAPDREEPLFELAQVSLEAGQLERAEGYLEQLADLAPDHPLLVAGRARLLELRGEGARAIGEMRRLVARRPAWYLLFNLANLEYAAGEPAEARRHLERVLEVFPGHARSRSFLAQLELAGGRPERAVQLYQELLGAEAGFTELSNLGLAYLLIEDYPRAAERFRQARDLQPENPGALLNLADAQWLSGRRDEARQLYRRLVELEPGDGWQDLTVRGQALAHLGRTKDAVAAVQEALRRAPDHPQAAYEASLVYALAGERTSALLHAERALAGGIDRRWFRWPWFDPLRDELEATARPAAE